MTWTYNSTNNAVPATHVNPTMDRYARWYFDNESVVINWTQGSEAATWVLRDYYGQQISSGAVSGSSINLGVLPLGWYKLYFASANPNDTTPLWGNARGEISFVVSRSSGPLRNTPVPTNESFITANGVHPTHSLTGMGQYRVDINLDSTGAVGDFSSSLSSAQSAATLQSNYMVNDSARPRPMLIQFPKGTGGTAPTTTDNSQIQQAVSTLYPLGYTYFEARNEPNTGSYTAAAYVSELQAFYNNVKAGNPNALVVGGCSVNLTDAYIDAILAAGAGQYMDVMSVHAYNGTNGNLGAGRESWDYFATTLAKYNFTKPVYMTEYGQFAWSAGSFEPRLQVQWMMLDLHLAEQHSVPRERYMWYYDGNVGFWGYPSFMWTSDYNNPMPTATPAVARVWSEETFGKTFSSRLNFGQADNEWIGSRFAAADGSATICLQSGGGQGAVSFNVTGATSLTLVDTFGNLSTLPVSGGKATVTIDVEPCYVRLPTGATFTPTPVNFGVEVVRSQFATPSASSVDSGAGAVSVVVDGKVSNGGYTIGPKAYRAATTDNGPSWFRLDFPKTTRLDRVHVFCPHPWQNDSTLLDFDLQYLAADNTTWVTAATVTDTSARDLTFKWSSHIIAGSCFTDSYWARRHIFRLALSQAVETKAIRLYVRDMSAGGGAIPEIKTAFGEVDANGNPCNNGQTGVKRMAFMEICAWLSGTTDGGTAVAGQPMLPLQ